MQSITTTTRVCGLLAGLLGACSSTAPSDAPPSSSAGGGSAGDGPGATAGSSNAALGGAGSDAGSVGGGGESSGAMPSSGGAGAGGDVAGAGGSPRMPEAGAGGSPLPNAGASGSAGTGALGPCSAAFCEDFETGSFDAAKWKVETAGTGNSAVVQKGKSAHGNYAAHFHYAGTRGTWSMALAKLPASLRTHHYGRANLFFQGAMPARHAPLITAGTSGFPNSDSYLEVATNGPSFQLTFVNGGGGEAYASGGTYPAGRWFCVGWEFNDTPDEAKVLVDDKQEFAKSPFTFNGKTTGLVGGFTDLSVGFRLWGSGGGDATNEIYYDDIAIDSQPLSCSG